MMLVQSCEHCWRLAFDTRFALVVQGLETHTRRRKRAKTVKTYLKHLEREESSANLLRSLALALEIPIEECAPTLGQFFGFTKVTDGAVGVTQVFSSKKARYRTLNSLRLLFAQRKGGRVAINGKIDFILSEHYLDKSNLPPRFVLCF